MFYETSAALGVQAMENDTGSSDTCVTIHYSINSRDDLHQSEDPSEGPSPLFICLRILTTANYIAGVF